MKKRLITLNVILGIIVVLLMSSFLLINSFFKENIPVIAYQEEISIKEFTKQIEWLKDNKYQTLSLDELYNWKNGKEINGRKVVIIFDFSTDDIYEKYLSILEKKHMKSTIFITESLINSDNYLSSKQIEELSNTRFIDVQSSSYNLLNEEDIKSNDYNIYNEDFNKLNYDYYSYPLNYYSDNYIKALKDHKYLLAFTNNNKWVNKNDNPYKMSKISIDKKISFNKFKYYLTIKNSSK